MAERVASLYAEIGANTSGLKAGLASAKAGLAGFAANVKSNLSGAGEAWSNLATPINQTIQILGQVGQAAQQAYAFISEGTQLATTERQFGALSNSIGSTADALLGELKTATNGTIGNFELMKSATSIMSLGLADTSEETVRLASLVGKLGWDMNQVTLTLANQSTMRLDSLGLSVSDVTSRVDALKEAGYSADQAFKFAILEAGEEKVKLLGDAADTTAGKLAILEANAANFKDTAQAAFSQELITNINDMAGGLFESADGAASFGEQFGKAFAGFLTGGQFKAAREQVDTLNQSTYNLATQSMPALERQLEQERAAMIASLTAIDDRREAIESHNQAVADGIPINRANNQAVYESSTAYAELQERIGGSEYIQSNAAMIEVANDRLKEWGETIPTVTGYIAQSAEALAAYNAETGDYITQALQADDLTISLGDAMYDAADAAGANAAALVGIKLALGEITPAQAEYLLQQAAMAAKATEFGEAIAAGNMTIAEAVAGLQSFSEGLMDTDVNINAATGSVYLFDDSITASSASTQNLLDKMGMITDVNATVTVDTGDAEAKVNNLYNKLKELGDPSLPTGGGSTGGGGNASTGGGGNIPQFAEGGSFIVPAGYPSGRPGMPIGVHSGEQVTVTPAGQQAQGGNTYNLYVTAMDGGANVTREFNYMQALAGG